MNEIQIEMQFLPDVYVPCEVCHGARYNREALEIRYKGKSFIDTTVWRFGDIVITLAFNALKSLGTALPGFALIAAAGGLASGWIGWRLATTPELAPDQSRSSGA